MKNTFKISIFLSFWFYSVEPLLIQQPPWGQNKVAIVERWPLWRGWNKRECMDCPRKKNRFVVESWPLVPEVRLYSLLITAHVHRSRETVYEVRSVTRTFVLRSRCTEPMYKIKLRLRPKLENTISAWASHYNLTYIVYRCQARGYNWGFRCVFIPADIGNAVETSTLSALNLVIYQKIRKINWLMMIQKENLKARWPCCSYESEFDLFP